MGSVESGQRKLRVMVRMQPAGRLSIPEVEGKKVVDCTKYSKKISQIRTSDLSV